MVVKLDLVKAYDRVEWDFLFYMLEKFRFNPRWIHWIRIIVTIVSYSILVNGELTTLFQPSKGIQQWDPLLPYLFILVQEVLFKSLSFVVQSGAFKGFKINSHCPTLLHILFANDTLLFASANINEAVALKGILDEYCWVSGQKISFEKSSVQFSCNTTNDVRHQICQALGMEASSFANQYLRLPSIWGRSKLKALEFLKMRISRRMQS